MGAIDPSPTWYRGEPLRSRCEADAAAFLDELLSTHLGYDIWLKNLLKYEGPGYRNRQKFYKPDWIFNWPEGNKTFFEIKPELDGLAPAELLDRMHAVRDTWPGAELVLMVGGWDSHQKQYFFDWPPTWRCSPPGSPCHACQPSPPPRAIRIEDLI